MKKLLNKLIKGERGQALPLVLILLLLGSLIIAPLLGYMGTGLIVGQVHENKMKGLYAADAGVEYAIHKILRNDVLLPQSVGDNSTYSIANVNGKAVEIEIVKVYEWGYEGSAEEFFKLLTGDEKVSSADHEGWFQIETSIEEGSQPGQLKYIITITYQGEDLTKEIDQLGAWLEGLDYDYVSGSANRVGNITVNYPPKTLDNKVEGEFEGGTTFIWKWAPPNPNWPSFTIGETKTQTFEFTPARVPNFSFAWVKGLSEDVYISSNFIEEFTIWKITATATDNSTGKQSEVISYVSRQSQEGTYTTSILTWEISP